MTAIPKRPLSSFALCPACLENLEQQRAAVGELGIAIAYCACVPDQGTFAMWAQGSLSLKPCNSPQEAQLYEASVTALIARQQVAAEMRRGDEPTH